MKNKIIFLFTLLFLLFVNPSYSLEDFNGYLNKELIDVCECSDYDNIITIENIGDELSNYKIAVQGALKENVVLSKKAFSLSPNEKMDINYALTKTCGKTGNYELVFDISSQNVAKRMSVPVSIKKCVNIELKTKKNVETICPCTLVKYQLELKNTGNFSENYLIDVSRPFKKWSKLEVKKITLAPGQETILDFYLRPDCGIYGNYSSVFKVIAEKTNLAAKMPLYLYILPCYDFNITLGDYYTLEEDVLLFKEHYGDYELCEKEEKIIPVLIENKAPVPNKYYLTLKAEDWARLERGKAIINAKNSTIVHLVAKPPEKLRENYTFLLESRAHWGDLKQKREFNMSVNWCYTPFIKTNRINVNYTKLTKQIEIQNQGVKEADYSFEIIEKPEWVSIEQFNITVLPNETKTINLISEPSEEIRQGNYNLVINTTAQNNVGYEHTIIIQLRKKGILGKAYDYLKQKIIFVYEKTKELVKGYKWYFSGGLAGLIVLLVILSLIKRALIEKKRKKELEEEIEEVKEVVKKKKPEVKKPKIRLWKYSIIFFIVLIILFAFSYTLIPEVFKGNFTAITTIYPGYPKEEINVTEVSVEEPERLPTLKERVYSYGKGFVELLKSYSYYIGFGILVLIFLIIVIRFVKKKRYEELEIEEKIKEKLTKEKKEEIKKIVKKKKKKKTDFYYILKILLLTLVAAIFIFAISYFRNYILFFINYIVSGIVAFILLILIITISKNKKIRKQFKKKWKSYFLILILILILFGIYLSYKNRHYEKPYNKTKTWISAVFKLKNMTYVPLVENITEEEKEAETEIEELAEQKEEIVEEEQKEEAADEEGIVISWEQNSDYNLDLKQYFYDPDNDILYFSSSQLENIDVEINEDGIAVIKPKRNWYGAEKVVFTADDNKGGVIESDEILLVVEKTDKPFLEKIKSTSLITETKNFLSTYSAYIVSGLVILVIVLFFLRRGEKKGKRKGKRNKKKKL